MHRWIPENPCCEINYVKKLQSLTCPIFMVQPVPELPNSVRFPKEDVLGYSWGTVIDKDGHPRPAHFNPNDFGSSLSWMFAMAIMEKPDEIGLWGIDMAANEEWSGQRPGLLSLIHIAKSIGIVVTTPPESDLIRPFPLYGYQEHDHQYIKLVQRERELVERIRSLEPEVNAKMQEMWFLRGALDDIAYTLKTWIGDNQALRMAYSQPERIEPSAAKTPEESAAIAAPVKKKRGRKAKPAKEKLPKAVFLPNGLASDLSTVAHS